MRRSDPQAPFLTASGLIDVPASKAARALLLGLLGLLLGGGLVMLIERVRRRIDTREELVEITDLPILAEIGFVQENVGAIDPKGQVSLAASGPSRTGGCARRSSSSRPTRPRPDGWKPRRARRHTSHGHRARRCSS